MWEPRKGLYIRHVAGLLVRLSGHLDDPGRRISIHRANSCRGRSGGGGAKEGVSGPVGPGLCGKLDANFAEFLFHALRCIKEGPTSHPTSRCPPPSAPRVRTYRTELPE